MPDESIAQFKAMHAAANGDSTLGIPKKVGQEFSAATPTSKGLPQRVSRPSSAVEAMTGLPSGKKKVRRGGGRHKAKPQTPAEHHQSLNAAMASGDKAGAKVHALNLAKALHAAVQQQQPQPQQQQPSGPSIPAIATM